MPTFELEGPDGKGYEVEAPSLHAALTGINPAPYGATDEIAHAFTAGLTRPVYAGTAAIGPALKQLFGAGGETPGDAYTRAEQEYDAGRSEYQGNHPVLSTALDLAGGVGALGPNVGNATTALGRIGQGAKIGGTYGTVEGAADSSGTLADRAEQAAAGGLTGGTIGAVIPAAIDTVRGVTAPVRAMVSAARNPESAAVRQVAQAMADGNISPTQARQALSDAQAQGVKDMTLGDVAGPNAQRLAAVYTKTPGPGKQVATDFMEQRAATRGDNIIDVARPDLGNPEMTYSAVDKLIEDRGKAADPAYKLAMKDGSAGVWNEEIKRIAGAPAIQDAAREAMPSLGNRSIAEGFPMRREMPLQFDPKTGKADLATMPNGNQRVPDLRFWDQVKRNMDAEISKQKGFNNTAKVDELTGLKNSLVAEVDKIVPNYAKARAIFEGPSVSKDAIQTGMKFLQMPPEEIRRSMASLNQIDKDFARLGAARALQDKAYATTDRTRELVSPIMKNRFAEIFPNSAAYDRAMGALQKIKGQGDFGRKVLGGSSTYENFAQAGDAQFDPSVLMHAASHNVLGLTADALRGLANRFGGITPNVAHSGVNLLLNSAAPHNAINAVERSYASVRGRSGILSNAGRGLTGGILGATPSRRVH